jgi:surface antigen
MDGKTIGTIAGSVVGGVVGSRFGSGAGQMIATALGAAAGGLIGREIAGMLSPADQAKAEQTVTSVAEKPVGQSASWSSPETGARGTAKVTNASRDTSTGRACKEISQEVSVGGQTKTEVSKVCKTAAGGWEAVVG